MAFAEGGAAHNNAANRCSAASQQRLTCQSAERSHNRSANERAVGKGF